MPFSVKELHLLVVEDNIGDFVLIENHLKEEIEIPVIHHAKSFAKAKEILLQGIRIDVILLDLTLPDGTGDGLVNEISKLKGLIPVVVLTGFVDRDYGIKTLSLGISDYLLKDDLNASQLYRSITYSIERKRIELKLRESELNYQNLFHLSPMPMWVYDIDTLKFLSVNDAMVKIYGYSRQELLTKTIREIRPEKEVPEMEDRVRINSDTNILYEEAITHQRKNGDLMYVELQSNIIQFEGRKAKLVIASDITEKIKSDLSLKASEKRFKLLVQEGADLIAIVDTNGTQKYLSPNSLSIIGIASEDFVESNFFNLVHEQDREKVMAEFKALPSHGRLMMQPYRVMIGDKVRWLETILSDMTADVSIGGIVANSRDITTSVENENKLKESVDRYNIVAKATSDIIWDRDLITDKIIWNKGLQGIFGYRDRDAITNVDWWYSKVHPEDKGRVTGVINHNLNKKNTRWQDEYRFQAIDGTYKDVFDRVFLVIDDDGKPIRMIGAMQDITRKKEEERRLKLLESVITNTNDAIVITEAESFDPSGPKIVFVNDAFTKMTGYTKEDIIGKTSNILHGPETDPDQLRRLASEMEKWKSAETELIYYKKNGEKFWVNMEIAPVSDGKGWFSHWITIQRDVSERVNYMKAIEQQNIKFRDIAWMQSHLVRAPLARIMGVLELLRFNSKEESENTDLITYLLSSATELDEIIRTIVKKTEQVENRNSK